MIFSIGDVNIKLIGTTSINHILFGKAFQNFITNDASQKISLTIIESSNLVKEYNQISATEICHFDFPLGKTKCHFEKHNSYYWFRMVCDDGTTPYISKWEYNSDIIEVCTSTDYNNFSFGLWSSLNMGCLQFGLLSIHSSVDVFHNQAIMCLGESGTGKSTHTRMWREVNSQVKLLNDDSPFIRITNGKAIVYGSPWSGKIPCYINKSFSIAAIMRIVRDKENVAIKLNTIESIGAIWPSCPPFLLQDEQTSSLISQILSPLIKQTKFYSMHCLPNHEAAIVACNSIFNEDLQTNTVL